MLTDYAAAFPTGTHDAMLFHIRVTATWPPTITPFTLTIPTEDDRQHRQAIDELSDPAAADLVAAPLVEHLPLASGATLTLITRYRHGVHEDATPDPDTVSAAAFAVWPLPPAEYLVLSAATPFVGNLFAARDDVIALVNAISFTSVD